ncbi:MAG: putative lipid II flippase FtsW [Spirochaetales bacterium]|nr:putative lipid II flippase FtsW [Spirochaetales bacterium]
MFENFSIERVDRKQGDFIILIFVFLLTMIGLVMMFSSSYYYGLKRFGDPTHFLGQQLIALAIGFVLFLIAVKIPLRYLRAAVPVILFAALALTVLTLIPGVSREVMGARRWLFIGGFSFQPAEFVKLALVLYLAAILSKKGDNIHDFYNSILPPLIVVGLFVTLIYLQNDFSSALFIFIASFLLFFIAGVPWFYFVIIAIIIGILSLIMIFSAEHRVMRVLTFIEPQSDPLGAGYQMIRAQQSLAQGGFWGSGFGAGTAKLGGLPEAHSDFVFAVLGEEAGFLGVLFVLALFLGLGVRGFMIVMQTNNRFRALLAFGLTVSILYQALLNMAVVSGLVPATGIPLPFFSHGGTSLMITLIMCGLLINVSASRGEDDE